MALGVGVIGVDPDRGWARESHVPAVHALDGLELVAVGSRRAGRAERAAATLGAARGYGDPGALIADPHVDVVAVAASVPAHRELVEKAARAGKHVYSEWPLGVDAADADAIAAATSAAGVHTAAGLQARANPATEAVARLVADGALGRVISASVLSTTAGFGPVVPEGEWYLEDPATGMHLVTIQTAHTLDLVERVLGGWDELSARLDVRYPDLVVGVPPRGETRTLADHVLVTGSAGGVPVGVEVAGGRPATDTPFALEIVGERRTARLLGGAPRGFQAGTLRVTLDGAPYPVPANTLPEPAVNVAATYAALRDDILRGTRTVAGFGHAAALAHLVDDVRAADASGRRVRPTAPLRRSA